MEGISTENALLLVVAMAWVLPWKGVALWKAARLSHKGWFVALLLLNTLAILDIVYIFLIASKYKVESTETEEEDVPNNGGSASA